MKRVSISLAALMSLCFFIPYVQAQVAKPAGINPCPTCIPSSGGGGGGTTPIEEAAALPFSQPASSQEFSADGVLQRKGVGAAVAPSSTGANALFVAYMQTDTNSNGDAPVAVSTNFTGLGQDTDPGYVAYYESGGALTPVLSISNPSIAYDNDGHLYLATIDHTDTACIWEITSTLIANGQQVQWNGPYDCVSGVYYSPSLTYLQGTSAGNGTLFMGLTNAADNTLTLEKVPVVNGTFENTDQTVTNFPDDQLGFSPGLGVFDNTVYIAIQAYNNSHDLYYWTTTDGQNLTFYTGAAAGKTSTTPSIVSWNDILFLGYRTDDSDYKFIYKYSTDGVNWTSVPSYSEQMDGPPYLINSTGITTQPQIINIYVGLDSAKNVWGMITQN